MLTLLLNFLFLFLTYYLDAIFSGRRRRRWYCSPQTLCKPTPKISLSAEDIIVIAEDITIIAEDIMVIVEDIVDIVAEDAG